MRWDDLIITVAYFSIPLLMVVALLQYPKLRLMPLSVRALTILFALFIFFCGTGHLFRCMEITSGPVFDALNASTAAVSLLTSLYMTYMVPRLFASLEAALDAESRSKKTVMTFMSFLCHEIRNPLFAITSTLTFMGDDKTMSKDQKESIKCIEQSVDLMLRLVNDVLDISRLESGKLQLEQRRFDLISLVNGIAASFRTTVNRQHLGAVDFKVKIEKDVPRIVMGDAVRLLQMVYNLLSNSAKFTKKGFILFSVGVVPLDEAIAKSWIGDTASNGEPDTVNTDTTLIRGKNGEQEDLDTSIVSFTSKLLGVPDLEHGLDEDGPRRVVLKLQVTDTGPGIDPDRREYIFEPYAQAKLSDFRKHGGTGLGLSIVSRLTEIMGGSIQLSSEVGRGSTFAIYIPVNVVKNNDELEVVDTFGSFSGKEISNLVELAEKDYASTSFNVDMGSSELSSVPSVTHASALNLRMVTPKEDEAKGKKSDIQDHAIRTTSQDVDTTQMESCAPTSTTPQSEIFPSEFTSSVLVVDDNSVNLKLLGRMLKHVKLQHYTASNGLEALNFMRESQNYTQDESAPIVGLVLMDWSMPVMDGCEATHKIREELGLEVPIVALTACALEDGLQELLKAGANEIATKPIIRNDLIRICQRYIAGVKTY